MASAGRREDGVHSFWAGAGWAVDAIDFDLADLVLDAMAAPFEET